MAGNLVPLVLIPRYSCYSGAHTFRTIAMDVTPYVNAIVNVWRSALTGTATPTWTLVFEESTDQVDWSTCTGGPVGNNTPAAATETQYTLSLKKRWFRVSITLAGTDVVATCWAVGFLEERES